VQKYSLADIVSLKFDSEGSAINIPTRSRPSLSTEPRSDEHASVKTPTYVSVPAGTRIFVRTIDGIDSTKNHVGDRFQASLEQPLMVGGNVVVDKGGRCLWPTGGVETVRDLRR
jgi:hypothetical protein